MFAADGSMPGAATARNWGSEGDEVGAGQTVVRRPRRSADGQYNIAQHERDSRPPKARLREMQMRGERFDPYAPVKKRHDRRPNEQRTPGALPASGLAAVRPHERQSHEAQRKPAAR